jgi:thiamine pyrophosphate-dependent acetolactate synthase large subunit-like protein
MDPFNSDTWKQQWTAFWSAPAIIGPLLLIVGSIVWWFRGRLFEAQVSGLKEQIAALEQRLKLASEASAASERARDELDKQLQAYKVEVAAKGSNASPEKVQAALEQLKREDAIVAAGLKAAQQALDAQYGAGQRQSLPRGAGFGVLSQTDYETLQKLELLGKNRVPGLTLNSIPDDVKKT